MFESLQLLPEDPVLGIPLLFQNDPHPQKVNLSVGAYQDGEGNPYVLESVKDAEKQLFAKKLLKNYLPIEGEREYIHLTAQLVFGALDKERYFGAQTVGGTSALRLGADFLAKLNVPLIALSDPSWPNHAPIFKQAGVAVADYPYYDETNHTISRSALLERLKQLPEGSAVLLQACCHNPTGLDLSFPDWQEIAALMKKRGLIPFFDFAYQGFGESLEKDAQAVRWFAQQEMEMLVASSYSKSMGLYGERAGFFAALGPKASREKVGSQIKRLIRSNYSNPPIHPAQIVVEILKDPALKSAWERELTTMRDRINCMREALAFGLAAKGAKRDFSFLNKQRGVFSFSGLTSSEVEALRKNYGIYLLDNGRMNVAGLNPGNLDIVLNAIVRVAHAR